MLSGSKRGAAAANPIIKSAATEGRLGRRLTSADFIDAPCNDPAQWRASERMRDRLADFHLSPKQQEVSRRLGGLLEENHHEFD